MGYLFTVQFGFWSGRYRLQTRNLETILRSVRKWLPSCVSRFIFFYVLFIYIFLFIFLASIRTQFLLRGVSIHILVFVNLVCDFFFYLFIIVSWGRRGGVQFWCSCMLMACNFINNEIFCTFTGFSVGECISSKNNGQPLFLLEVNFTMDIRYFSSSF